LLSWWWPRWPESLMIIQPETGQALALQWLVGAVEISITKSLARRSWPYRFGYPIRSLVSAAFSVHFSLPSFSGRPS
jgi:hypothetical protein